MDKQNFFVSSSPSLEEIKSNGLQSCVVHFLFYPKAYKETDELKILFPNSLIINDVMVVNHHISIKDCDRLIDIISFMMENIKTRNDFGELIYRKSNLLLVENYFKALDFLIVR